jgi:hypothetical protein
MFCWSKSTAGGEAELARKYAELGRVTLSPVRTVNITPINDPPHSIAMDLIENHLQ